MSSAVTTGAALAEVSRYKTVYAFSLSWDTMSMPSLYDLGLFLAPAKDGESRYGFGRIVTKRGVRQDKVCPQIYFRKCVSHVSIQVKRVGPLCGDMGTLRFSGAKKYGSPFCMGPIDLFCHPIPIVPIAVFLAMRPFVRTP
jgi:hypothetical protein